MQFDDSKPSLRIVSSSVKRFTDSLDKMCVRWTSKVMPTDKKVTRVQSVDKSDLGRVKEVLSDDWIKKKHVYRPRPAEKPFV